MALSQLLELLVLAAAAGLGLGFIGLMIVLAMNQVMLQGRRHRERLEALAERWKGVVAQTSWTPHLGFELDGRPARVRYWPGAKNNPAWTRLEVELPAPGGRLHVVPQGAWALLKKAFGAEDIHLDDPAFDQAFLVQGRPAKWVRSVLDPATRQHLRALSFAGARLDITAEGLLRVQVHGNLLAGRPEILDAFMERATALARGLMGAKPDAPRAPPAPPVSVRPREQRRCPVCADAIAAAEVRRCGRCETAHHADCWEFIGGCAVFGCDRERPRDRPRAAAPERW